MNKSFSVVFFMLAGLFLAACSGGNDADSAIHSEPTGPLTEGVTLSAQVTSERGGRIQVEGVTNLPSGTRLSINLGSNSDKAISEVTATVSKGEFVANLPIPDSGLTDGSYQIKIVVAVAGSQSKSVQTVIGKQGQHLTGPHVKDISWGGRIAEISLPYTVSG